MKRFKTLIALVLILNLFSDAAAMAANKLVITCSSPKRVTASVGYKITCTSNVDLTGSKARLQLENVSEGWQEVADGKKTWEGSELYFNRIYKDPKTDTVAFFRVFTEAQPGVNKATASNSFETWVDPYKEPKKPKATSSVTSKSTQKWVTIPNFIGMEVQWLQTHRNSFPGIYFFLNGSSCSVSNTLSGNAVVISQNPAPMQKRAYNSPVQLGTNC